MIRSFTLTLFLLFLGTGCQQQQGSTRHYDGEKLAREKCSRCHNLDMPPKTSDHEAAPPLYTVTVHLKDWMKTPTPDAQRQKFIDFVADYVLHPSRDKSYCDPKSLELYGLMPSQKGKVTPEQLRAIAAWIYDHYDQMAMLRIMKERNRLAAMPPWKQVLETRDCRSCHILGAGKLAPSFPRIARRYADDPDAEKKIRDAILHGSRGKWPAFHVPMRAYDDLTPQQLEGITRWILDRKEENATAPKSD